MLERAEVEAICHLVLDESTAEQVEVLVSAGDSALTRYAENRIHQNVAETGASISIRAVQGQRIGISSTNDSRPPALRAALKKATELAAVAPENPQFPGLPSAPPPSPGPAPAAATINSTPEQRGEAVRTVLEIAAGDSLNASGALETSYMRLAVANSEGAFAYGEFTRAGLSVVMQTEDSSGRAEAHTADVSTLDAAALAATAAGKALVSRGPRSLEPGAYTVILEPLAVADMIFWLAMYGFNALSYQEKRSFLCDKLGQKIASEQISLGDDGLDPRGLPMTFDFEGVPKQPVELISQGRAVGMVHDSRTAAHADPPVTSTGHALPAPNPYGPVPTNLFLRPGDATVADMIRAVDRGLLVTRFHYTNMIHPIHTVFTGMTRDGTFLIEDGEIMAGVQNLRFTQSILEALEHVKMVGSDGLQCEYCWTPPLLIEGFNFTGVSGA
jgi:predicted Zn-dependent protease